MQLKQSTKRIQPRFQPCFTIVDDDEHTIFFVIRALSERFPKSAVTAFRDGIEALVYLKKHRCDCLITDLSMVRMNGDELIRQLQWAGIEIPTLMMSSSPDAQSAAESVAVPLLDKSSIQRELVDIVEDLIASRAESKNRADERSAEREYR